MVEVSNKTRAALYEAADIYKPRDYDSELQWLVLFALTVLLPLVLRIGLHTFDVVTCNVAELRWLKRGFTIGFELLLVCSAVLNWQNHAECQVTDKNKNYPVEPYNFGTWSTAFAVIGVLGHVYVLADYIENVKKIIGVIAGMISPLITVVPFTDPTIMEMACGCVQSVVVSLTFWAAMRSPDFICTVENVLIWQRSCAKIIHVYFVSWGVFACACLICRIMDAMGLRATQSVREGFGLAAGTPTGQQVVQFMMPPFAFNPPAVNGQRPSKQNIANIAKIATKKTGALSWPGGRKMKDKIWIHFHANCLINGSDPDKTEIKGRIEAAGVSTSGQDLEEGIYLYAMQELVSLGLLIG